MYCDVFTIYDLSSARQPLIWKWFFILMQVKLIFSEGILNAHACFCWTTIAWAHQMWWREIENSRELTVIWRAIYLVLWIQYFPTKTVLHINDKQTDVFYAGFSCRFFSGRFSRPFLKRLNAKNHCSCINLIFTGRAMHFYDFYGLISKLMVLLIKSEMHCSNVQLL